MGGFPFADGSGAERSAITGICEAERERQLRALIMIPSESLVFGLFFLFTWLVIAPQLLYQYQSPVFLTTLDYLKGFLDKPGGPIDYVSAFLAQFCFYPWAGALIITAVAWLVCLATRGILRAFAGAAVPSWLSCCPAILLLMLHGQYDYRLLPSVALLVALLFVNLYVRMAWSAPRRLAAFAILSALLYWVAGGIYVLFAVLCGLFELVRKRQVAIGVLYLLCAPAVPFAFGMYSYDVEMSEAFVNLHPYRHVYVNMKLGPDEPPAALARMLTILQGMHAGLMLFFPLAALAARFEGPLGRAASWCRERARRGLPWNFVLFATMTASLYLQGLWRPFFLLLALLCTLLLLLCTLFLLLAGLYLWIHARTSRVQRAFAALSLFLVLGALLTWASFDGTVKKRLLVDYYGEHGNWEGVLETARGIPARGYDIYVMHEVNRALYHTGKLPYEMCSYPQFVHPPTVQLTAEEMTNVGYAKFSELSLELGNVNFARHWGHTALEIEGSPPRLLKLLIKVNILQGRTQAAKAFLGELHKNLLYRGWADRGLQSLESDPTQAEDGEFQRLRAVMLDRDYGYGGFGGFTYEEMFMQFLRTNPKNRMAFEYLMAFYLLTRQFDKVCANLWRLDDFDYEGVPRLYEEAFLLQASLHPDRPLDLHGQSITRETAKRFDDFFAVLNRFQHGPEAGREEARQTLVRKWGDTYFFYAVFGFSEPRPGWKIMWLPPKAPGKKK